MVFTSNRQGGFGGFDLWYSIFDGTEWSEPKNFGERINTEYDEYRPFCFGCYKEWSKNKSRKASYCLSCGRAEKTTIWKPLSRFCFEKSIEWR